MLSWDAVTLKIAAEKNLAKTVSEAQSIVDQKNIQLGEALHQIAVLQEALAVEQAHSAGLKAEIDAMKPLMPSSSPILKETGKVYPDGEKEIALHRFYNKAFDSTLKTLGFFNPGFRRQAQ